MKLKTKDPWETWLLVCTGKEKQDHDRDVEGKVWPWVCKEVAGDPQHFDSSPALQLEGQVCHLIQIPVGLLQGGALRRHVSVQSTAQLGEGMSGPK